MSYHSCTLHFWLKLWLASKSNNRIHFLVGGVREMRTILHENFHLLHPTLPKSSLCTGSVKDSVVGEERIAQYLLAVLNTRGTPLHWKNLNNRRTEGYGSVQSVEYSLKNLRTKRKPPNNSGVLYIEDLVAEVQHALYLSLSEFKGDVGDENDLEELIDKQFETLQNALKIPHKGSESRLMVSKKFLTLFRTGKLGPFILDDVPDITSASR